MRAARLLQILLLLQNRGKLTCGALAEELEVTRRTILRDVEAMGEAGLPILVTRGKQGGIELGFNYRTRLTGLAADEAEALAILLERPAPELAELGLLSAAKVARNKLLESLPDGVRQRVAVARQQFRFCVPAPPPIDERVAALAAAIRRRVRVRLQAHSSRSREVYPVALISTESGWQLVDAQAQHEPIPLADWGNINVSGVGFDEALGT